MRKNKGGKKDLMVAAIEQPYVPQAQGRSEEEVNEAVNKILAFLGFTRETAFNNGQVKPEVKKAIADVWASKERTAEFMEMFR